MSEPASPQRGRSGNRVVVATVILLLVGVLALASYKLDSVPVLAVVCTIPFVIGALLAALIDPQGRKSPVGCIVYPTVFMVALGALAWMCFGEGAICVAMVLPIWIPVAIGGAIVNRWLRCRSAAETEDSRIFQSSVWAALPALAFGLDIAAPPQWQPHVVSREMVVTGSAEEVWPLLLGIPAIGESEGRWTFAQSVLGVPRPSGARLVSRNGALVRVATWGKDVRFEERITQVRRGQTLAWQFAFPDDSVRRYTDHHISPGGDNLKVLSGRYDLVPISPGRTRVRLTTRYISRTWLDTYASWWGERLLGDVETNVLAILHDRLARAALDSAARRS